MREGVELRRFTGLAACILAVVTASPALAAPQPSTAKPAEAAAPKPSLQVPHRLSQPPSIDGVLDDEVWRSGPLETGEWLSYNPLHGTAIPQKTKTWIAYDADYLYFAFQCDDPEPSQIKTSITRRDNIWSDDWVGLSLDALGTGQLSYHLLVNPSGVQLDMLNSASGGEDTSPDYVWDSAGRQNATGYAVEIRLPLQTIRFPRRRRRAHGDPVLAPRQPRRDVGVLAGAHARHLGVRAACVAAVQRPPARLAREVIPSATYARNESRATPSRWGAADDEGDFGVSAKYGITSTVTLDATINPDFSQVESDAFQVEVNQRFPVFFSEKRPFFMEGSGIFTLAGEGNDNSLQRAVHTRRIVDPIFGAKLTGNVGRFSFGTLTALDQAPGRNLPETDPDYGQGSAVQRRARAVRARTVELRGRAGRRRRVRRRLQPRHRRRPVVARQLDAARQRLPARVATRAIRTRRSRGPASARSSATSTARGGSC